MIVEVKVPSGWNRVGTLGPSDPTGSISDVMASGQRDVYIFSAIDDNHSGVYRSKGGADVEIGTTVRVVHAFEGLEVVKELGPGEQFILTVRAPPSLTMKRVRFRQT